MKELTEKQDLLDRVIAEQPYPLLFSTVSGAHLYGFASGDSDFDLRGVHVLPAEAVLGMHRARETVTFSGVRQETEIDLVTHDAAKFFALLRRKNGYVLEQLCSPLVLRTCPEHEELKEIAKGCITRHHVHHYLGFFSTQWKLFAKKRPPRVKPLLYVYRVLLTGIHLMRTGEIEANLLNLNREFNLSFIDDLIARKTGGAEKETGADIDIRFHEKETQRLCELMKEESERSRLPERPGPVDEMSDLLVRLRFKNWGG